MSTAVTGYPSSSWQKPAPSGMLCLLLVFLAGVTVGALTMSTRVHRWMHTLKPIAKTGAESPNQMTLQRWKKELDLTAAQSAQIETLLDDISKYYDNLLADGNSRIRELLNERQKEKFDQILKERK